MFHRLGTNWSALLTDQKPSQLKKRKWLIQQFIFVQNVNMNPIIQENVLGWFHGKRTTFTSSFSEMPQNFSVCRARWADHFDHKILKFLIWIRDEMMKILFSEILENRRQGKKFCFLYESFMCHFKIKMKHLIDILIARDQLYRIIYESKISRFLRSILIRPQKIHWHTNYVS